MGDDDHPGVRGLLAALLGVFGFSQIPFGFYLAASDPVHGLPAATATGVVFLLIGSAMLFAAFRLRPRTPLAVPSTAVVRSRLRWFYGMLAAMIAVIIGIGVVTGGFAAIPSARPRDVVAAVGTIGLGLLPAVWLIGGEHRILGHARALDDHGRTVTARVVRVATMDAGWWGAFLTWHWSSVGGEGFVTYQFDGGLPTVEPVDRETYHRVRVGDRVAVVCLPENPTVSRVP